MERKVEAGLDFRLTLGGGKGAIKIGGIRNKEKEEEKPEADRNWMQVSRLLALIPESPVVTSFSLTCLLLHLPHLVRSFFL